ncbi:hypothetical protein BASA81_002107 [Batrachochytrium salamandrivorans]|nr:hypothetical protein BASA81_002107 [Batrachochytrium salamandrivorans]
MQTKKLREAADDKEVGGLLRVEQYSQYDQVEVDELQRELNCQEVEIVERCYSARLIGQRKSLVLHGGGNSSVKLVRNNLFNEPVRWLAVKGSGYDQANIVPRGFPLVDLERLRRMCLLPQLSDDLMVNEFRTSLQDSTSPTPSVESLLHAMIDAKFVDHSHASAVVALACQTEATSRQLFAKAFAGRAELTPFCIVPYVMPGFDLAVEAKRVLGENPNCKAMILLKHGLFTWGDTAKESYDRHVLAVNLCEELIAQSPPRKLIATPPSPQPLVSAELYAKFSATLRGVLTRLDPTKGKWIISRRLTNSNSALLANEFVHCAHSQRGCCTPDHVIRTKRVPLVMLGLDLEQNLEQALESRIQQYVQDYNDYFDEHALPHSAKLTKLDPLPRVMLVEHIGLVTMGRTWQDTQISADIYEESIKTILSALHVTGEYEPCSPQQVFQVEYWVLEQAKLKPSLGLPLLGHVCLITGGGSGIGLETARKFAQHGCAVFVVDLSADRIKASGFQGVTADVTSLLEVQQAVYECCRVFGGVDILVSNAGVFTSGNLCWEAEGQMHDSMQVNFFAHHHASSVAVNVMQRQQTGGCLLFNVSKAPMNPGPKAGAYAIAKAATGALMRQLALECAPMGITSNAVNADRVRTNLFDLDLVASRAQARNLSVDEYFCANLLGREVTPRDVADAFYLLSQSTKTTGTYFCVDGGCLASAPK